MSNVPSSARRLAEMRGARAQITADRGKRCNPGATKFSGSRTSGRTLHHTSMNLAGCWIPLRHACASQGKSSRNPRSVAGPRRRAHAAKSGLPRLTHAGSRDLAQEAARRYFCCLSCRSDHRQDACAGEVTCQIPIGSARRPIGERRGIARGPSGRTTSCMSRVGVSSSSAAPPLPPP